jgi:chemotaxis signal transduction protein
MPESSDVTETLATLVAEAQAALPEEPRARVVTVPSIVLRAGARWYALAATTVREVVHLESLTHVPGQPRHVLGVALVHGRMVGVVDLGLLIEHAAPRTANGTGRLVVLGIDEGEIGVIADEVRGVIELATPTGTAPHASPFVIGEVTWNKHLVATLNGRDLVIRACLPA